jgi:hypothetical protein
MKARPTEYKGVRFRSKSEAVFARYLDLWLEDANSIPMYQDAATRGLITKSHGGFQYEPRTLIGGWCPDFLFWMVTPPHGDNDYFCWSVPLLDMTYIEYKPSRPTDTYIDEWREKTEQWAQLAAENSIEHLRRTDFRIYYGSPFSSAPRGIIHFECGECDTQEDWVDQFPSLMDYRFDLQREFA